MKINTCILWDDANKCTTEVSWHRREILAFRPPPDMPVSDWSDDRRILQPGTSRQPGPWSTSVTPYLEEPMNSYNHPDYRHVVLCFGTQLGKTECLYNMLGYIIDLEPYSTMVVYPRVDDAKTISRTRVQPMFDESPTIKEKIPSKREKYQQLEMHFPGMALYLVGANSAAALAQKPCRNILRDEIDKYPQRVGSDADPLSLSEERTKSFWDIRKIIDVSSPTLEDIGIWKQLEDCDEVRRYYAECPFCLQKQILVFEQIKFDLGGEGHERINIAKNTATYQCIHCNEKITDKYKSRMIEKGEYRSDKASKYKTVKIGYHVSSLYSPWLTWGDIAEKFLKAKYKISEEGSVLELQNFYNGWLAKPWKDTAEKPIYEEMQGRITELPPRIVPKEAIALTCGVDVQKYGFYYTVWAWTKNYESWLVDYGYLVSWDDVRRLIFNTEYDIENDEDHTMSIWRTGVDTGGGKDEGEEYSKTEETYMWLRKNSQNIAWGVKGMTNRTGQRIRHSIIDKMPGSQQRIPGGLVLWFFDSFQFKEVLFWRISNDDKDPQPLHFHAETDGDFFNQLLAEEKRRNKNMEWEWVKTRKDNHYLDCCCIAHACADPQWSGGIGIVQRQANPKRAKPPIPQESGGSWIGSRGGSNWLNR